MKKIVLLCSLSFAFSSAIAEENCGIGKKYNEFSDSCVEDCQFGYKWNNYTQSCIEDDMEEQEDGCED